MKMNMNMKWKGVASNATGQMNQGWGQRDNIHEE